MYKKIVFIILLIPSICIAKTIDVQLWNNSARFSIGNHDEYASDVNMEVGFFWNNKTNSRMFSYGITTLTNDYIEDKNTKEKPQLFANIGLKLFALELGDNISFNGSRYDDTAAGLSIGVEVSSHILANARFPMRAIARAYYAPSVVIFNSEFDSMHTLSADLEVLLQHNAIAYVGYHIISADLKDYATQQVDDSLHIGFKILY